MSQLFELSPAVPQGFTYTPDFITPAEESELLTLIGSLDLHTFIFQGFEAKRRVASYGYDYSFDRRTLKEGTAIPGGFSWLIRRAAAFMNIEPDLIQELLVTEYPEGSVINWHRDAPPFDVIAGISLLSDCVFRLRPHEKQLQNRGSAISFPVRRRSIYILQDEARTAWQHSIQPVKTKRYSVTLRTLKNTG